MSNIDTADIRTEDARVEFERTSRDQTDLELEPITSEDEDYESAPSDYQITTYPADYTLEGLHQKWQKNEIVIPEFQRGFVWKQVQSSKLIESFLVGLPVPAVFLYSEHESQKYLVIDGQQRLKSVFYYFEGYPGSEERGTRKAFNLKGLHPKSPFHEKEFDELGESDQRRLNNAVLRAFIVRQLDPNDDTSMYHIFERLNTGGTLLANQEVRNCVYRGEFVGFLEEINKFGNWRSILGKQEPDSRRKDIELLVRFFAMQEVGDYKKPMKDFLSRFMWKHKKPSKAMLEDSRQLFEKTCNVVMTTLGQKPFHVRSGMNTAIFDAVMVAFSKHLTTHVPKDIKARYKKLVESNDFNQYTRQRTTDVDSVRQRFHYASRELFGT